MKKHLFKLFYAAAVILLLIFVIGLVAAWFWYQDVSKNPLVELVPFSSIVKDYALKFLYGRWVYSPAVQKKIMCSMKHKTPGIVRFRGFFMLSVLQS